MEGFWTLEQWRRVFSTCGRRKKDRRQGRSTMVSSPLHFHRQQLFLFYFFNLRFVESFSPFVVLSFFRWRTALRSGRLWLVVVGFCVFCHAWAAGSEARLCCTRHRQTTRVDGWIDDFSPPTSFLHRRCRPPPPWLGDRCPFKFWFSPPYLFLAVFQVGFVESREAELW